MKKIFDIRERLSIIAWQGILKDPSRLTIAFNRMLLVVLGRYTKGWSITAFVLAKEVNRIYKRSGYQFCSQYLKSSSVALMNYLSSSKTPGKIVYTPLKTRVSLTRKGIPRLIHPYHRRLIRQGGKEAENTIRCYLTLFGFYRTFVKKDGRPDLSSIIKDGSDQTEFETPEFDQYSQLMPGVENEFMVDDFMSWIAQAFPTHLISHIPNLPTELKLGFDWRPTWTSGPNSRSAPGRTSVLVFRHDLNHYKAELENPTKDLAPFVNGKTVLSFLSQSLFPTRLIQIPSSPKLTGEKAFINLIEELGTAKRGRWGILGKKLEGGGKIRIFAMLDSIRQALFRPIHNWFMGALRSIPQDGTYDQLKPLYSLIRKRIPQLWSYDLKSATDRFPRYYQNSLIQGLMGTNISSAWELGLSFGFDVPFIKRESKYRFMMGQPLGAYSSWAVFSLTHHALIQYCSQRLGYKGWFPNYAILGDDIVIGDSRIAALYREALELSEVQISVEKSIISDNQSCEFAKHFIWKGVDVSPISFKEVYTLRRSTCAALVKRLSRFRKVSRVEPYRWFGAGYRVRPTCFKPPKGRWKRFNLMLIAPGGPFEIPLLWWFSLYSKRPCYNREIGIVQAELLDKWKFSFEPEGIPSESEEDIVEEILVGRPWITSWLSTNRNFLLGLQKEIHITSWFHRPSVPSSPDRPLINRELRLGKMYWIYDRMASLLRRPPLCQLPLTKVID